MVEPVADGSADRFAGRRFAAGAMLAGSLLMARYGTEASKKRRQQRVDEELAEGETGKFSKAARRRRKATDWI